MLQVIAYAVESERRRVLLRPEAMSLHLLPDQDARHQHLTALDGFEMFRPAAQELSAFAGTPQPIVFWCGANGDRTKAKVAEMRSSL